LAGGAQQAGMPASFGYEFGKKASGPWEAFIGGGWEANKRGFSGDNLFIPQDPLTNQLVGGLAGLAGFLF
jgi:hypothetical protein